MINVNTLRAENLVRAIFGNVDVHVAGPYSIVSVLEDVVESFQYHRLHSIRGYHSRATGRLKGFAVSIGDKLDSLKYTVYVANDVTEHDVRMLYDSCSVPEYAITPEDRVSA